MAEKEVATVVCRMAEAGQVTPMMQQYMEIKLAYQEYILMYRLGDFFEMFFDDAVLASKAAELTLTSRDCGYGKKAAMCGVPFHKLDAYIGKLVEAGFCVAVCEQTEDPKEAKGLVKREIVRLVTPGTITDTGLLQDSKNNYLAALCYTPTAIGLGFADISTGQISVTTLSGDNLQARLQNEMAVYAPRELILSCDRAVMREVCEFVAEKFATRIDANKSRLFDRLAAEESIRECYGEDAVRLESDAALGAVGALLAYIRQTQLTSVSFVDKINVYTDGQYMDLDVNTRRNLELTETLRNKEKRGTLLWVLDKTKTAMGGRMMRAWITKPLLNIKTIQARHAAVQGFLDNFTASEELRVLLSSVLDLERLTAKTVYGSASPKELRAICQSLLVLPEIVSQLSAFDVPEIVAVREQMDTLEDLSTLLDAALQDNPPFSPREGDIIRDGYNTDVDYLRSIEKDGNVWKQTIEAKEREATGIKNLRVGFNHVFGYYIEVSKGNVSQVPETYIRKQTLANCERYITQELKEMEATVLGAKDKLVALEYNLFTELRETVAAASSRIQLTASLIGALDVYLSFAEVATKNHYVRPEMGVGTELTVKDGRHPVVEQFVSESYFVPNDTKLDTEGNRLMLITGPNMAGKSTYMRQVALIAIMAQIGSFVPAAEAHIDIIDKVFTRVGASDDLASGQSTFMLEMNEVAYILRNATFRSLVIYDEVGRGTSTYDGMSIARAVAEYTASQRIGAKTLFATHYHELTEMEGQVQGVVNYNIAAKKRGESVTFLRKIIRGATDDSYGIEVAKLAGVPQEIVRRAKAILADLEADGKRSVTPPKGQTVQSAADICGTVDMIAAIAAREADEVADKLRKADLNTMTPLEAMNMIFELKKLLTTGEEAR